MKEQVLREGYLRMMDTKNTNPVQYFWTTVSYESDKGKAEAIFQEPLEMNALVGKKLKLEFDGRIRCIDCGIPTKKSVNQGACFGCFKKLAKHDMCILRPETCHFHLGTCRDREWGKENCFKKHTVYLANTSGMKVGITKEVPVSNRWVDQGAMQAIPIVEVDSRKKAGIVETALSKFITDKSAWQRLVTSSPATVDLEKEKEKFVKYMQNNEFSAEIPIDKDSDKGFEEEKIEFKVAKDKQTNLEYPILVYPKKAKSLKIDSPILSKLIGIKGQYLLFEDGVINIRSHGGYFARLSLLS